MKSERDLIGQIRAMFEDSHPDLLLGIGDDAALVGDRAGCAWAISKDLLVEDVHFSLAYTDARLLGRKAMAVNLSDLAAVGAEPAFVLLSLALTERFRSGQVEHFLEGAQSLIREFGVVLIGGDLSHSPDRLVIDVAALGKCKFEEAVRRDRAKPGDQIFVSGRLGASRAGLELLKRGLRLDTARTEQARQSILSHLDPSPRVPLGRLLAGHRLASAMIDLSDGLSTDLGHVCEESRVGAIVHAASIPTAEPDSESNLPTLEMALHGGEDYELLFTVPAESVSRLKALVSGHTVTRIGEITAEAGAVYLEDHGELEPLPPAGFDHFR